MTHTQRAARRNDGVRRPAIVVESALTRPMYGRILLLLGIRSWGFVLLVGVAVFLGWTSVARTDYTLFIIYVGALVAIYGGAILFSVLSRRSRGAYITVRYTFDDSKVKKETTSTSQTLGWNSFVRWRKIGAYYLIYQSKRGFFVIPRSKIPVTDVTAFEGLLASKIVGRRRRVIG